MNQIKTNMMCENTTHSSDDFEPSLDENFPKVQKL